MRINVHDFSGHPFQVQLSRELAERGHEVEHIYSAQYVTGRGRLNRQASDPATLQFAPLTVPMPFDKYNYAARVRFEISYGRAWSNYLAQRDFDAVIACNLPLLSQARAQLALQRRRVPWVFWHQDIYSQGMTAEVRRKLPAATKPLGRLFERIERRQIARADHTVAISETFMDKYADWHVPTSNVTVIPNWAPLDELRPVDRDNAWSAAHDLPRSGVRLLYSGTLGRKHNPLLLLELLDHLQRQRFDASLTVCSEGVGADELRAAAAGRTDVLVLDFQPAEQFEQVLSSADVVVALLEPDASTFSVPSKVLSYLAAGRIVVGLMPADNPAAADIASAGGYYSEPTHTGVADAAEWITHTLVSPTRTQELQVEARAFAERNFDISAIGDRFESILNEVAGPSASPRRTTFDDQFAWDTVRTSGRSSSRSF